MEFINRRALFSDESEGYVIPFAPEAGQQITIRLRAAKDNLTSAGLLIRGKAPVRMEKVCTDELFDFFEARVRLGKERIRYAFQVCRGGESCYYQRFGAVDERGEEGDFLIVPGFRVPDWARGSIYYQIFVDRFCNGDPTNDVVSGEYQYLTDARAERVTDWNSYPAALDVSRFYGGDLQGVLNRLDYLQNLGVEVIYFNPIFVSPSNHKYDTQDYDHIDPHYGVILPGEGGEGSEPAGESLYRKRVTSPANLEAGDRLFIRLVEEAHRRGIRVILDGVFNHCGSFNKWMDRQRIYEGVEGYAPGAYISADSPYRSFFLFGSKGKWPYNPDYRGWWNHDTLPKLNYEQSKELYRYMLEIGQKWVSPPYCADGWRLDVAADLGETPKTNHRFWQDFREAVREANPEAVVLAEHYGDPTPWLNGREWDTVMNYDGFMEPVSWFLTGMEKHGDEFRRDQLGDGEAFFARMRRSMGWMPRPALESALNELSNHDHSRFLTRTNHRVGRVNALGPQAAEQGVDKDVLREAVVIQMTWPGAPGIYYGDEVGLCGFTDPDNRRSYPWGHEDFELLEFHCDMAWLRRRYRALQTGAVKPLLAGRDLVVYGRFTENERIVVVVNSGQAEREISVPVWEIGIRPGSRMLRVMQTRQGGYNVGRKELEVGADGCLALRMHPVCASVYRERPGEKD